MADHVEYEGSLSSRDESTTVTSPSETMSAAGRLHANAVRIIADKLVAAEQEARQIRLDALAEAAAVRQEAAEAMVRRTEQAERSAEQIIESARADAAIVRGDALASVREARAASQDFRDVLERLFVEADGLATVMRAAFERFDRLEQHLDRDLSLECGVHEVPPPPALDRGTSYDGASDSLSAVIEAMTGIGPDTPDAAGDDPAGPPVDGPPEDAAASADGVARHAVRGDLP